MYKKLTAESCTKLLKFYKTTDRSKGKVDDLRGMVVDKTINKLNRFIYIISDYNIDVLNNIWMDDENDNLIKLEKVDHFCLKYFKDNKCLTVNEMIMIVNLFMEYDSKNVILEPRRKILAKINTEITEVTKPVALIKAKPEKEFSYIRMPSLFYVKNIDDLNTISLFSIDMNIRAIYIFCYEFIDNEYFWYLIIINVLEKQILVHNPMLNRFPITNIIQNKIQLIQNSYHSKDNSNLCIIVIENTPQITNICDSGIVCASLAELINEQIPYEYSENATSSKFCLLNQEMYISNYRKRFCTEILSMNKMKEKMQNEKDNKRID